MNVRVQVILSPVDSVADTYRALLPEGTPMEFQRILELKVIISLFYQNLWLIDCWFLHYFFVLDL